MKRIEQKRLLPTLVGRLNFSLDEWLANSQLARLTS